MRIAPSASRYFEVYVFTAQPIAPRRRGHARRSPTVDQDVETVGCDGDELASFSFRPDGGHVQSLAP